MSIVIIIIIEDRGSAGREFGIHTPSAGRVVVDGQGISIRARSSIMQGTHINMQSPTRATQYGRLHKLGFFHTS